MWIFFISVVWLYWNVSICISISLVVHIFCLLPLCLRTFWAHNKRQRWPKPFWAWGWDGWKLSLDGIRSNEYHQNVLSHAAFIFLTHTSLYFGLYLWLQFICLLLFFWQHLQWQNHNELGVRWKYWSHLTISPNHVVVFFVLPFANSIVRCSNSHPSSHTPGKMCTNDKKRDTERKRERESTKLAVALLERPSDYDYFRMRMASSQCVCVMWQKDGEQRHSWIFISNRAMCVSCVCKVW